MIVGIGVDVAEISRLGAALARRPALASRLFAESERGGTLQALAGCFAAKEAVAKALGVPRGLRWTDAILTRDESGRPVLAVAGTVAAAAARLGVTSWHVSISHDAGICVAMVVAEQTGQDPAVLAGAGQDPAVLAGAGQEPAVQAATRPAGSQR